MRCKWDMLGYFVLVFVMMFHLAASEDNSLQREIDAALKSGKKEVRLAQQEYRLKKSVVLRGVNNVVFDGGGAKIIMTERKNAWMLFDCSNLTFQNFSIDYDPLPYTQGTVTAVNDTRIEFKIDEGYPQAKPENLGWNFHAFTPDGKYWKKYQTDIYGEPEAIDATHVRIRPIVKVPDLQVGDRLAMDRRNDSCIDMRNTKNLRFEDITVYASPGCVFRAYHCDGGDIYRNVKILRGPKPIGAQAERLLSANADAIHYGYCRKGVTIVGCEFAFMGDDSLNLHGNVTPIVEISGIRSFRQIVGNRQKDSDLLRRMRPGDKIRVLARDTFRILGEYTFRSYRRLDMVYSKEVRNRAYPDLAKQPAEEQTVYELTVNEEIGFSGEAFWDTPSMACSDFRVSDSYFHDHRARGLRVMASNGIIENCRFERIKGPAISAGPESGCTTTPRPAAAPNRSATRDAGGTCWRDSARGISC